jgi:hypothetical protein
MSDDKLGPSNRHRRSSDFRFKRLTSTGLRSRRITTIVMRSILNEPKQTFALWDATTENICDLPST